MGCRASAGQCDVAENCTGTSGACPADGFAPRATPCTGASQGGVCDNDGADHCSGTANTCVDVFQSGATVCRTSAGQCDVAENCTGTSGACPTDAFKSSSTVCRAANGACDVGENCTGTGPACPADHLQTCITDSSLCSFDVAPTAAGSQFRLIFTPDTSGYSKLNASNPGQFVYNVFQYGSSVSLNIKIPYPFVTQGAVPVHVYDSAVVNSNGCVVPGTDITSQFTITPNRAGATTLGSYSPQNFGSIATITVAGSAPSTGQAYVWVHLDYGLELTTGYSKALDLTTGTPVCDLTLGTGNDNDAQATPSNVCDNNTYTFTSAGSQTIQNNNAFKKDPGIGGLALNGGDSGPVANVKVLIYDSSNKLLATVYTDQDGWYMWQYKYTGRADTFTVKLPAFNKAQTVTLKSNGFLVVNFTVP
jgi:hypothetical protein